MPTVQGTDDFNHAINAGFYTDGFFGTPTAVGTPLYASQPATLSIVTDGGNVGARHNITGTPTFGWAAFPFRVPATSAGNTFVHSFGVTGGATVGAIALGTTGLFTTVGGDTGTEFPIFQDIWYWVETIMDVSSGTHSVYMRVNGADADPASVASGATTITWSQLISFAGDPAGEESFYGWWQWGSATSITDWLGEPGAAAASFLPARRRGR